MYYDLIGIGAGPFNLSLAALSEPTALKTCFLDRQSHYQWHPGMLLPGAKLQNSFLRDLVTAVDPTNRHSFLNYLVESGRFYQFLHAEQSAVSRQEFSAYLQWVASRLESVHHNSDVVEVDFCPLKQKFSVQLHDKTLYCQNLSLGTGKKPKVPLWAEGAPGEYCFHASEIALRQPDLSNKRVVIVGGGQSGAEIFLNTLNKTWGSCAQLTWVSRRSNLEPLDETPFTNEYFAPKFQQRFFDLPVATKKHLLASQKLASDGISPDTLKDIYQALYQREVTAQCRTEISIFTGTEVTGLKQAPKSVTVRINSLLDSNQSSLPADVVILCTGYQYQLPACFAPLAERLNNDAHYGLDMDKHYRTRWDGPEENRIYGMNAGLLSHGIADPQMSINAVRAATITNDLSGVEIYPLRGQSYLQWSHSVGKKSTEAA